MHSTAVSIWHSRPPSVLPSLVPKIHWPPPMYPTLPTPEEFPSSQGRVPNPLSPFISHAPLELRPCSVRLSNFAMPTVVVDGLDYDGFQQSLENIEVSQWLHTRCAHQTLLKAYDHLSNSATISLLCLAIDFRACSKRQQTPAYL